MAALPVLRGRRQDRRELAVFDIHPLRGWLGPPEPRQAFRTKLAERADGLAIPPRGLDDFLRHCRLVRRLGNWGGRGRRVFYFWGAESFGLLGWLRCGSDGSPLLDMQSRSFHIDGDSGKCDDKTEGKRHSKFSWVRRIHLFKWSPLPITTYFAVRAFPGRPLKSSHL